MHQYFYHTCHSRYCTHLYSEITCNADYLYSFFPLFRYRNFRTFTTPQAVQFSCLSVDSSGEVVCAGSLDTFEIFVWCMKTGRLIEVYLHLIYHHLMQLISNVSSNTNYDQYTWLWSVFKKLCITILHNLHVLLNRAVSV